MMERAGRPRPLLPLPPSMTERYMYDDDTLQDCERNWKRDGIRPSWAHMDGRYGISRTGSPPFLFKFGWQAEGRNAWWDPTGPDMSSLARSPLRSTTRAVLVGYSGIIYILRIWHTHSADGLDVIPCAARGGKRPHGAEHIPSHYLADLPDLSALALGSSAET